MAGQPQASYTYDHTDRLKMITQGGATVTKTYGADSSLCAWTIDAASSACSANASDVNGNPLGKGE